jgi:hypothetical protein
MQRFGQAFLVVTVLALPLAGCESINNFDPSEWMPGDIFGTKKKLVGHRKPVFPEGVPGLERGVPPDLMRDPQAPGTDLQDVRTPAQRAAAEPEAKAKAKARPKAQPKQAEIPEPSTPTPVTVRPSNQPRPSQPQSQSQPPAWPDAPTAQRPSGAPGGVQWPEPPPTR